MIVIFWLDTGQPKAQTMDSDNLSLALNFMQELRKLDTVTHVVWSCEFSDSIGKSGVTEVDSSYNWRKRR